MGGQDQKRTQGQGQNEWKNKKTSPRGKRKREEQRKKQKREEEKKAAEDQRQHEERRREDRRIQEEKDRRERRNENAMTWAKRTWGKPTTRISAQRLGGKWTPTRRAPILTRHEPRKKRGI